jgi:predicted secreted protein
MTITAALVLYSVTWFMVFFIVLPIRFRSQADAGEVVPGTPASAPAEENVKRKAWITTLVAVPLASVITAVILWGGITIRDLDVFGRMGPETTAPAD